MLLLKIKRIAAILAVCILVVILCVVWLRIRDNRRVRYYGENASEAYVIFNKSQRVFYRLDKRGSKSLVDVILKETAAHPLPKHAIGVLVEVVFIGADGKLTLSCALPGPKGVKSFEDAMIYWERIIQEIESATQVLSEDVPDKLDGRVLYFVRRRSK